VSNKISYHYIGRVKNIIIEFEKFGQLKEAHWKIDMPSRKEKHYEDFIYDSYGNIFSGRNHVRPDE
jgi:hypothetical protein